MGSLTSRPWTMGTDLDLWLPPPWPKEHTDDRGRVVAFMEGGRWSNPWMSDRPPAPTFFWDLLVGTDESGIPGKAKLDETLPVKKPPWTEPGFTPSQARMTWLGHATVLAELEGATLLTDPMFSQRASLSQWAGPARYRGVACSVKELPPITAVLISHNHYDHLDLASVQKLVELQPNISWFVPQGMKTWLEANTGVSKERVKEQVWWQEEHLGEGFKVVFTPANHWCKRGVWDDNKTLWGSWAVLGPTKRFWFGGDTGYCEAFRQIGRELGPFDMAAIPIGAYQPNWFMKYQHVHPGEAVQIHRDIQSRQSLGIHWGTFKLTTEYYLEPAVLLTTFMNSSQLDPQSFVTTDIGGSVDCQDQG